MSQLIFAETGLLELSCDINKVQSKDWSEDLLGYQQDNYQEIFPMWLSKAKSGGPKYQFYVAKAYSLGNGVEADQNEALFWYKKSSDNDYPAAKNNLALMYEYGQAVEQDPNQAFRLVCDAAIQGVLISQFNMGRYYQYGFGTDKDVDYASLWHQKAIKNGIIASIHHLGVIYFYGGNKIVKDNYKAFKLIKQAADSGYEMSFYDVGLMYYNGWGTNKSIDKSIKWFKKGVEVNNVDSANMLFAIYIDKDGKFYDESKGFEYTKVAAELGNVLSADVLGGSYMHGLSGVKKDYKASEYWYLKNAESGSVNSQRGLAYLYYLGDVTIRDYEKAFYWAKKASNSGDLSAKKILAQLYEQGDGVVQNTEEAAKLYHELLLSDDVENKLTAASAIADQYRFGFGSIDQDINESIEWYKMAEGYASTTKYYYQKVLGDLYVSIEDFDNAKIWFKKAADAGDKHSENHLHYLNNIDNPESQRKLAQIMGISRNKESLKYYERSANQGDVQAQNDLGEIYVHGNIVPKDYKVALYWLRKAAQQGHSMAQNNLGNHYHNGFGVEVNIEEALHWYRLSADQGNPMAMRNIASIYSTIIKDQDTAIRYYEKSANLGNADAMWSLSIIFRDGIDGVKADKELAFEWALRAAEKRHKFSQFEVGMMYLEGEGVDQDYKKSVIWLTKALDNDLDNNYRDRLVAEELDGLIGRQLGYAYAQGKGVDRDWNKAVMFKEYKPLLLDSIAETGSVEDKLDMAIKYELEVKDYHKALEWYIEAAKLGNIAAQRKVGDYYSRVEYGLERDFLKAEVWYKKAIENNDIESKVSLAWLYILSEISPGIKNPIYDPKKGVKMFLEAREEGSISAIYYLVYVYRYGEGVDQDVEKSLEMLKELIVKYKEGGRKTDELFIKALEIQTENGAYKDDSLISKGMELLISLAQNGDVKKQFKLGKIYLTKDFKFYNEKDGMYWIEKSSSKSIEANQYLSELYWLFFKEGGIYNHKKHGDALKKAINLFERKHGIDYSYYKNYYNHGLIYLYQTLANYYSVIDAPELAEINLRKAAKYYIASENNKYEIERRLILANSSDDLQVSEEFFNEFIEQISKNEIIKFEDIEDIDYFYRAITGMHQKYRDGNRHKDAAEFLIGLISKFKGGAEYYKPNIMLEIARDFSRLGDYDSTELYLTKYKEAKESIKPGFLDNLLAIVISSEKDRKTINDALESFEWPVERILFGVLEGIVSIYHNDVDSGYRKIINSLDKINSFNIPIRARDLDFSVEPIEMLLDKEEYSKAASIIERVVGFYKDSVALRASNNYRVSATERDAISDAISEYIYASQMADESIKDKGFEAMQLASGLTLSDSVIKAITRKQLSGTGYIKSKQLSRLESNRRDLIKEKFSMLSFDKSTTEIDKKLDLLDDKILNLNDQISSSKTTVFDLFISSLDSVQETIPDNDALITMLVGNKRSHVWLITNNSIYRHDSNLTKSDITKYSKKLLNALNPTSGNYVEFPFDASSELYDLLIKPFENQLSNVDRLVISPDVSLSNIPFSILTKDLGVEQSDTNNTDQQTTRGIESIRSVGIGSLVQTDWLINNYAIATVPSVYSYIELEREKNKQDAVLESFAGIGNPILSGSNSVMTRGGMFGDQDIRGNVSKSLSNLAPLPETENELYEIASMFTTSKILVGKDATEVNVRNTDLSKFDVIAFATHALVSNEIDRLFEPSLVLTPIQENNSENDGLLTASEVSELDMDAEIVLLSACNTASSFGESNSQGLSGLANSFFNAGAKSLLVSYWSVISESAVDVTTRIFKPSNNGRSYAHKHRNAVLDLLQNSKDAYKLHPSYWAPFSVIGVN